LKVISAEFVTSAAFQAHPRGEAGLEGIPRDGVPQIAMIGRSNVGKSTLLNALARKKIARTSAAPGKTRLANVYRLSVAGGSSGAWPLYLVDLPGYGYARGGTDSAAELAAVAEGYLVGARDSAFGVRSSQKKRPALMTGERRTPNPERRLVLLLVDSRHPGLESDVQAARWLTDMGVAYQVVATKIDKLSRSERARNLKALELTFDMPPLAVSAASGEGMDVLWKTIASLARTGRA
jgi:GTP-binding protein